MKPSRLRELLLSGVMGCCGLTSCRQLVGIETEDRSALGEGSSAGASGTPSAGGSAASGTWLDVTANLVDVTAECGAVTLLAAKPDEDAVIVGVASHGLWMSRDGGASWAALGGAKDPIVHQPSSIVFDPDDRNQFWETGLLGIGVHRTIDGGRSFTTLGGLLHIETLSVDLTDPARKILMAGGYEQNVAQISRDGGVSWQLLSQVLPGSCSVPLVLDAQTYVLGCDSLSLEGGIYRSSDGGAHWSEVSEATVRQTPLWTSDNRIYWLSAVGPELLRSVDGGRSWLALDFLFGGSRPIELPNGWLASLSGGVVVVSSDHGAQWRSISPSLPSGTGDEVLTYSSFRRAFFATHSGCRDGEPGSIVRYDYDLPSE
jgi:photosystem II stability/assembly factor-like uncharacterized protein